MRKKRKKLTFSVSPQGTTEACDVCKWPGGKDSPPPSEAQAQSTVHNVGPRADSWSRNQLQGWDFPFQLVTIALRVFFNLSSLSAVVFSTLILIFSTSWCVQYLKTNKKIQPCLIFYCSWEQNKLVLRGATGMPYVRYVLPDMCGGGGKDENSSPHRDDRTETGLRTNLWPSELPLPIHVSLKVVYYKILDRKNPQRARSSSRSLTRCQLPVLNVSCRLCISTDEHDVWYLSPIVRSSVWADMVVYFFCQLLEEKSRNFFEGKKEGKGRGSCHGCQKCVQTLLQHWNRNPGS